MSITVPEADILGKRGLWLLDFTVGGRPFRFAESRIVVLTEAGEELLYSEGLGELEVSVVQDPEPTQTVTISSNIDWALLVAQGNPLDLGRATLTRHFTGQTLERSRVQLRGDIESPGYDRQGADLTFTIAERPNRLADPIIRPHARIDEDTFPISGGMFHIDEKSGDSRPYLWVFGFPGQLPNKVVPAVPVPICEARNNNSATRVLLTRDEAHASDVDLWMLNDGIDTDTRPVDVVRDLLNVQVSTATVGALTQMKDGGIYYAGFSFANGGGVLRSDRSGPLRGAGEITRFVMDRFIRRVGLDSRFDAVQDILDQWKIDTYLDGEDVSWWEFLTNELWPLLPVVQVRGPDGIYLEVIDFAAEERDTRFELNADRRAVTRVPGVQTVGGEGIANEITLKYAPRRDSGKFHKELTVSGDDGFLKSREFLEPQDRRRVLANVFCRRSQDLYGTTRRDVRTTHMIWDRATAGLTLGWWAARDAIPRRRLRYRGSHGLESVPPWKPIVIRDSELHLDGAIGWLEDIVVGPAGDEAIIIIQDHPHIGTRATT